MHRNILLKYIFIISTVIIGNQHSAFTQETDSCMNCTYAKSKIDELYFKIQNDEIDANYLLSSEVDFEISMLSVMTAHIENFDTFDDLIVLFFIKEYLHHLQGKEGLNNVSCCFHEDPALLIFTLRFFEISNYDPTVGLFTEDIYNWAKNQNRFHKNAEINFVLNQIKIERMH